MSETLAGLSSLLLQSLHSNLMPVKTSTNPQNYYPHIDIPAFCDKSAGDNARQHIDLEIQRLEDAIRSLKSRRNTLAPISRLPPEILSQIFIFCASGIASPSKPLGWIKISHICRHWRATAVNCPTLWSNIVTTLPKWTEEMLRRSKMTSIILEANLSYMSPKALEAVRLALQHIGRMKGLKISAPRDMFESLIADLPADLPLLQSLSLSISQNSPFEMDEYFNLPEKLFSGDVSRLRRLKLDRCNPIWDSPMFNGLTILKIWNTLPLKRPTTTQLLDVLERMPALEILHLREALPLVADEEIVTKPTDRIINLSRLSHISTISTVSEFTNIFNHIKLPRDVTYSFKTQGTEMTGYDFSTILNAIPSSGVSIRALDIIFQQPATLTILGWLDSGSTPRGTPHVELALSWQGYGTTVVESVMTAACKVFSLIHLEDLFLSHIDCIKPKAWVTLFGGLPKIRSIHVRAGSAYSVVSALRQKPVSSRKMQLTPSQRKSGSHKPKSRTPPVCFPNLQILTLDNITFNVEHFNHLRDCLMERCEQKAELQELRLFICTDLLEGDVKLLRELVVNLNWDGVERSSMDEDILYGDFTTDSDFGDYF